MADSKKFGSRQIWVLENFSVEFFIIFGRDATIKEEEIRSWRESLCFQKLSPLLPHNLTEINQQGQIQSIFRTYYLGKSVEESQFARQGSMVSGGVPQGFQSFFICEAADGFN